MAEPFVKPSFASGEMAPSLYGRVDLTKWHAGCSVGRNMFVSYKGGLSSRAGTAFVGQSKQAASASSVPPRLIKFKFNLFQSYELEFGDLYMRVIANGGYVTEAAQNITGATQANPCQLTIPAHGYVNGDWIFIQAVLGMTRLNGRAFVVQNATLNTLTLADPFGNPVNSLGFTAYSGPSGTAARIYTLVTPYAAVDLPYLKFTQSADVMSITVVNQQTLVDYPPADLTRLAANNWTLTALTFQTSIAAPASCTATASTSGSTAYSYLVTAVAATGEESVASPAGNVTSAVDIATTFGTITVGWAAVAGAVAYNIYKAPPSYSNVNQAGQLYGFAGQATGSATSWQDTNIIADFTTVPPTHQNPFASKGNYPGVVSYFQERRTYGYTLNGPDTYEMSQPGAFLNFDTADPPIASDAITGTPWATQVNGIQWMLPMPGGLIVLTGEDAWQVAGSGGAGSAITPAQQSAQPQESNGASPFLPPIKIGFDILYGQALGSIIRDLQYNFYTNIYAGADITVLSSHLFEGRQILQWAWAKEPYKVVWAVRDDGKMLSLTYLKEQELVGWCRHDTNGLVVSVATASEPPVDAVYWVVKRFILGVQRWAYYVERMDNRLWQNVEQCWCVDAGLALPQPEPNATLTASTASLLGGVSGGTVVLGGSHYTNPSGRVIDPTNQGSGAVPQFTVLGGVITGMVCNPEGQLYGPDSYLEIADATGSGASIALTFDNPVTFTADQPVFGVGNVASVIRMGGGIATITAVPNAFQATAQFSAPITSTIPCDPNNMPVPAAPGSWSMTAPVASVSGLDHLEGMLVNILADGSVVDPMTVANGAITLPQAASQITIGLPFLPQMQTLHASLPSQEIQGKHKKIVAVTMRVEKSRGIKVGQDQPIAATQPNQAEIPWGQVPYLPLSEEQDRKFGLTGANAVGAGAAIPLFTGDIRVPIVGDYNQPDGQRSPGMVGLQQDYPLPMNVLALIPEMDVGDTNG